MCPNSWAITPSSSSRFNRSNNPVVTATAAFSGELPVANAFGDSSSIMKIRGIGTFAIIAISVTIFQIIGAWFLSVISLAWFNCITTLVAFAIIIIEYNPPATRAIMTPAAAFPMA